MRRLDALEKESPKATAVVLPLRNVLRMVRTRPTCTAATARTTSDTCLLRSERQARPR